VITYLITYNSILIDMTSQITPERAYEQYIANFSKREERYKRRRARTINREVRKCLRAINRKSLAGAPAFCYRNYIKYGKEIADDLKARGFNANYILDISGIHIIIAKPLK
jgi:hypothetical protein